MIRHNFVYAAGLNATELGRLNSSVLPYIRQSAVSLIPPECLAVSCPASMLSRVFLQHLIVIVYSHTLKNLLQSIHFDHMLHLRQLVQTAFFTQKHLSWGV